MTHKSLHGVAEALNVLSFDTRSRKAADDVVEALRRIGGQCLPSWSDYPALIAVYWKARQLRDVGVAAKVSSHVDFKGEVESGLMVGCNLKIEVASTGGGVDHKVALQEFLAERSIALIMGRDDFDRLSRLSLGPDWYRKKWPPAPKRMYKWINICEADLKASDLPDCKAAKLKLTRIRKEAMRILKSTLPSLEESTREEFDVFSL